MYLKEVNVCETYFGPRLRRNHPVDNSYATENVETFIQNVKPLP